MAHVRMSIDLGSDIVKNAVAQYEKGHLRPNKDPVLARKVRQGIIDSPFQQAIKHLTNHDYFSEHLYLESGTTQRINTKNRESEDEQSFFEEFHTLKEDNAFVKTIRMQFANGLTNENRQLSIDLDPYLLLPFFNSGYRSETRYDENSFTSKTKEELNPLLNKAYEDNQKWITDKEQLEEQIRSLVNRVNTLKQFLDVYPAGEKLVPNDKLVKMHEKTTRKMHAEQVKQEIGFDLDKHNETALISSLLEE